MEASTTEDVIHAGSTKDTAPQDIRQQTARHGTLVIEVNIIVNGGEWGDTQASTSPHTKHIASTTTSESLYLQAHTYIRKPPVLCSVQGVNSSVHYHDNSHCACAEALLSRD